MPTAASPVVKRSLSSWIFSGHIALQLTLLGVVIITVFARVVPLEMQKRIVNEAINLRKLDLLYTYCAVYLAAVLTASGLKFLINTLQTLIGQRTVTAMRQALYQHILTLPLNFFRKTPSGMVVSSLITELPTAGDFVGMAVAVPITSVLTLLAFAGYLFWLNPLLALLSLSIYPVIILVIPLLQKRVNRSNVRRVDATRSLSSRIGEAVTGIHEIQANGAFVIENRKFDRLAERLMKIRIIWNLYRFAVKTSNNLFTKIGPFLVFIVGGYLAINGRLEIGALVAFLSAQEQLYNPWRELIDFFQAYQNASVSYRRTMEYFDVEPEFPLAPEDREVLELDGRIEVRDLSFVTDSGIALLNKINLSLHPGQHLALVGFSGSGKSTLAQCLGQLYRYTGGQALLGGREIAELTRKDLVHNIGFVSQAPFIFAGTIEENLLYACAADKDGNGNGLPGLDDMIAVLHHTGIFGDVLRFGLNAILDPRRDARLIETLVRVRENFQQQFGQELAEYVEFFDEDKYLYYSSVAENLTFGTAGDEALANSNLAENPYFLELLNEADLTRPLLGLGAQLTRQTIDILGSLPPEEIFFEQSPLAAEELDDYKRLNERLKKQKLHQLEESERKMLLQLALRFIPGIHKMVSLPEILENLLLEGRSLFRDRIAKDQPEAIAFYQPDEYIRSQSILNNIFFGKSKTGHPKAMEKIDQSIIQLLIAEDLLEKIVQIGMQYEVGTKGDRLSGGQRQKLAIARAFLKNPRVLILDEATSALDNKSQARIQNLLENRWKGKTTLIAVVHRLDIIRTYDRVAVMKAGQITEMGTYDELIAKKGMLHELEFGRN